MKQGFILALVGFLILFLIPPGFAATKTLTFAWNKPIIEPDLAKFELQSSIDAVWGDYVNDPVPDSGTWTPFCEIPFVPGQTSYVEDEDFTVPDGTEGDYFFRIRALDGSGNVSGWCYGTASLPCKAWIDFKPPGITINLTVTVSGSP